MRLSAARVERALSQLSAQAIPDSHPVMPQLSRAFGDHTFFIDDAGLLIVEPADSAEVPAGQLIKVAAWSNAERTSLTPHEPEATDVVIALGAEDLDGTS
ncbi:MAG: hypothetical protein KIT36_04190 [Alphaproteobacteria bacterium]|nr:hypothetical protein [Alphaproteobacteria bacterium]